MAGLLGNQTTQRLVALCGRSLGRKLILQMIKALSKLLWYNTTPKKSFPIAIKNAFRIVSHIAENFSRKVLVEIEL